VSQLAPVNSTVTFFCHARGDLITWYLNGDIVDYRNEGSLRQRGFTFADINSPPEVNKTMSVSASLQNNNTNITCGDALGQGNRSPTANLLVAGKQLSNSINMQLSTVSISGCMWSPLVGGLYI